MKKFWLLGSATLVLAAACYFICQPPRREAAQVAAVGPDAASSAAMREPAPAPGIPRPGAVAAPVAAKPSPAGRSVGAAPVPPPAVEAFNAWAQRYCAEVVPAARAGLLAEGETLVRARHAAMTRVIKSDPERALGWTVPYGLRRQMPLSIRSQLEQPVDGRGDFKVVMTSPLPGQPPLASERSYRVVFKGRTFEAYPYGRRTRHITREGVSLHGVATTDERGQAIMAVSTDPVRLLTPEEASDLVASKQAPYIDLCPVDGRAGGTCLGYFGGEVYAFCDAAHAQQANQTVSTVEDAYTVAYRSRLTATKSVGKSTPPDQLPPGNYALGQGVKRLLLMPVLFADDPTPPVSLDSCWAECAYNNQYYEDGSYGIFSWISTVTPFLKLPYPKYVYGEGSEVRGGGGSIVGDAMTAARNLGFLGSYDDVYTVFTSMPQYSFGGRSDGLLNGGVGALPHELGHSSMGVIHANFWDTTRPSANPPTPGGQSYPVDVEATIGHDDINAPFDEKMNKEYGDIFDVMGSGGGHFSTYFKNMFNWLPDVFVRDVTASCTNRIYAFDTPSIADGRLYALRIRKNIDRDYWISYRQGYPNNPWLDNGVEVTWNDGGNVLLLDTTPGSPWGKLDAGVVVGRTYMDEAAGVYLTPVAKGADSAKTSDRWIDVVVQIGPFPDNLPPTVTLQAQGASNRDLLNVTNGAQVDFVAQAQDPNGDTLAYRWDFGDGSFSITNRPTCAKVFTSVGQYVVRCEVSDMKGGIGSAFIVVIVGEPSTHMMFGRIVDDDGTPLQGVRVHNCGSMPQYVPSNPEDGTAGQTNSGSYRVSYTDSDGYYAIANVDPGSWQNRAYQLGFEDEPLFDNPVDLSTGDASGLDHLLHRRPRVSVAVANSAVEGIEFESVDGVFEFKRECSFADLGKDLTVFFQLGGSAVEGTDYLALTQHIFIYEWAVKKDDHYETNLTIFTNYAVTIPAYETATTLNITPIDNSDGVGPKTVVLDVVYPTYEPQVFTVWTNMWVTNFPQGGTNGIGVFETVLLTVTNVIYIPGWDLKEVGRAPNKQKVWTQSLPTYIYAPQEAVMPLLDDDPPGTPAVSVYAMTSVQDSLGTLHKAGDGTAVETRGDSAAAVFVRTGSPVDQDLVVYYSLFGDASNAWDYAFLPGQITIPAGRSFVELTIPAINDLFAEGNEFLLVNLNEDPEDPSRYTVAGSLALFSSVDDDLPTVWTAPMDSFADRTGNNGLIRVFRTGSLDQPLKVNYLVTGTAQAGSDYQLLSGSVTIAVGQVSADVVVRALAGASNEIRTVTVLISDSTTYNIDAQNSATVTLLPAWPTVTCEATATSASEPNGKGTYTFTRTGATTNSLRVYFTLGGTAAMGDEYSSFTPNYVDIPIGASTATVTINARANQSRDYGDLTRDSFVLLQLQPGTNYNVGSRAGGKVTIRDGDEGALPAVGFMLAESSVREDAGSALIPIRISANPSRSRYWVTGELGTEFWKGSEVSVLLNKVTNYVFLESRVVGGTAVPGVNYDTNATGWPITNLIEFRPYSPPDPPIPHEAHEDGILMLPVPILNDGVAGGDKTITLRLFDHFEWTTNFSYITNTTGGRTNILTDTNIVPASTNYYLGAYNIHTLRLLDVGDNVVNLSADSGYAYEQGQTPVRLTITRSGALTKPLTVYYATGGTAAGGNDYVALTTNGMGAITIPAGTNQVSFMFVPKDDPTEETAESAVISLLERPGYTVGSGTVQLIVVSDDGTIQFGRSSYPVAENAGEAVIEVIRTGNATRAVTVDYRFLNGSATNGVEFLGTNGTLRFEAGESYKTFTVPLVNDTLVETTKTALLLLTNATGGVALGGQNSAQLVILDDDVAFEFATNIFAVAENVPEAVVSVNRLGVQTNEVSVAYWTQDQTGIDGLDYFASYEVLTFAPGQSNRTAVITLLDNPTWTGDRTVGLVLGEPQPVESASFGTRSNATLLIVDDDCLLQFTAQRYFVNEYEPSVTLTVTRIGGTVNPVTVDFFTADGTALSGDDGAYYANAGTLSFAGDAWVLSTSGDGTYEFVRGQTNQTIRVNLLDNELGDGNRDFSVVLTNAQGPASAWLGSASIGQPGEAMVTILDDEVPGAVDYRYNSGPGPNDRVRALALQPSQSDRAVVFGGDFTTVDGFAFNRIARLQPNGVLDPSFNPGFGANDAVYAVAIDAEGKIVLGGDFSQVNNVSRTRLARLNFDGGLDPTFVPGSGANGLVRALAVQVDGKILLGGDFTTVAGQARNHLARLRSDGTLDPEFVPDIAGSVYALALQSDGAIVVGGDFGSVNGGVAPNLARLLSNGQVDGTFRLTNGPTGRVSCLALQADGRIVVGGLFTFLSGAPGSRLARFLPNGALDRGFDTGTGASAGVNAVAVHASGKILVAGDFTTFNGQVRPRLVRLRPSGAVDGVFNAGVGPNATVAAAVVQPNSAVVIGGDFTEVNTLPRRRVARLHGDELSTIASVELAAAFFSVSEDAGAATITAIRTGGNTNLGFSVEYALADGSAVAGVDYDATPGTLEFAPGQMSNSFSIPIIDNPLIESDKTLFVCLTNAPANVDLSGVRTATLTIVENQKAVRLGSASYVAHENDGAAVIVIQRLGHLDAPLTVTFFTAGGTAQPGPDYGSVTTNLLFAPGESNKTVRIPLVDDLLVEPDKTLQLWLTNAVGGSLAAPSTALLTILDHVPFGSFTFTNSSPIQILDVAPAAPYPSVIQVTNLGGAISRVTLTLDGFTHSFPSDVRALLVGPDGRTSTLLLAQAGANYPVNGAVLAFDDAAPTPLPAASPIATGTYRPSNYAPENSFAPPAPTNGPYGASLTAFNGSAPAGDWRLYVADVRGGDAGVIGRGWRLALTTLDTNNAVDLALGARTSAATVMAGQVFTYALYVTNRAASIASNVLVLDTLPADFNLLLETVSSSGATLSNGVLRLPLGTLASGAWRLLSFKGYAQTLAMLTNTAQVSADQPDLRTDNNTVTTFTLVTPPAAADLSLEMDQAPNPALAGQAVMYTLRVTNHGPLAATGVWVTNQLPELATFLAAYQTAGDYAKLGNTLGFHLGTLAPRTGAILSLQVLASVPGALSNWANVGAEQPELNADNNAATVTTTVLPAAELVLSTAVSVNADLYGFTYTVINRGPSLASGVTLFAQVPTALSLVSAGASQGSSAMESGILVFQLGTVASGGRATATLGMRRVLAQSFSTWANVLANQSDPDTSNNTVTYDSSAGAQNPRADLALGVAAAPVPVVLGSNLLWTLTVTNQGPSNAPNVVVTSRFSPGLTLLDALPSQGGCRVTNGMVICQLGTLALNQQASFSVLTQPTTAAPATNGSTVLSDLTDPVPANNAVGLQVNVEVPSPQANPAPITLYDSGPAGPYPSVLNVSNLTGVVKRVKATVRELSHSFASDVSLLLVAPSGHKTLLMSHCGGRFPATGLTLTFDDEAGGFLPTNAPLASGTYRPTLGGSAPTFYPPAPVGPYGVSLGLLQGGEPNGQWRLYGIDDHGGDAGVIAAGWSLAIETAPERPRLEIQLTGSQVVLSWPAVAGYVLEYKDLSGSPAGWVQVPDQPSTVGNRLVVLQNATGLGRMYRLRN